ncbi:MAG: response regulator transcription factor [Rubrivivax sp.]
MTHPWTSQPRRVLVIDDHLLARAGARALIDDLPGYSCVAVAADAAGGLRACLELRPDLVLLDLNLPAPPAADGTPAPRLAGLDLALTLQRELPRTRVLVLSAHADAATVSAALRAGASAYVTKDVVLDQLAQALRAVCEGHRWLSPEAAAAMAAADRPGPRLTPRQRDVLQLLAGGRSNKEIARQLGVSVKTVEYHRAELITRLDLHDVASLTRYAVAQGLVA